jgi:fructokinase
MRQLFGGIEAGGTKFACIVGSDPDHILAKDRFPTTTPEETIGKAIRFLEPFASRGELTGVGIGCFGPLDLNPASPTFGTIITTPKAGWANVDIFRQIRDAFGTPVTIDTDVNAAAYGEYYWTKSNHGCDPLLYMTVGTGIGIGVIANALPLHGLVHPEGGHMSLPHDRARDPFEGNCPFHGDCLEGLASGPAMAKRWGMRAEDLARDHPGWALEAEYLGYAVANMICMYSPKRIIVGGGVTQNPGLLGLIRQHSARILNGYIRSPAILDGMEDYLIAPTLGVQSGTLGCIAMAKASVETQRPV